MKELEEKFEGRGEVKGYSFELFEKCPAAYIYKKMHVETGTVSYEVFKRKENTYFDCVSYPTSKAFGVWAWEYTGKRQALCKFNALSSGCMEKDSIFADVEM